MDNGYMQKIRARILAAEDGAVFVAPDFADIADTATIRQGLKRLYQSGIIRRIIRGIYEKPKYSKLLDEYVAADPDAVAKALARCYHWTIAMWKYGPEPVGSLYTGNSGLVLHQRRSV